MALNTFQSLNENNLIKNEQNLLSLTIKTSSIKDGFIAISSYNDKLITINEISYNLPLCILGKYIFEWNNNDFKNLSLEVINVLNNKFFSIYEMFPEVILIGLTSGDIKSLLKFKNNCHSQSLPVDLMSFNAACRTFNILSTEERRFSSIFI